MNCQAIVFGAVTEKPTAKAGTFYEQQMQVSQADGGFPDCPCTVSFRSLKETLPAGKYDVDFHFVSGDFGRPDVRWTAFEAINVAAVGGRASGPLAAAK